ncbi:MAG: hypothetical protein HS116_00375 [Planctomycetes bacterium]|nr:hypothetical protein [Planctomycetota bacterium]
MPDTSTSLWRAQDCAAYLRRSPRWLWAQLSRPADQPGSIPHVYVGRTPRFFPDDIAEWVRQGCPPAATFAQWQASQSKRASQRE